MRLSLKNPRYRGEYLLGKRFEEILFEAAPASDTSIVTANSEQLHSGMVRFRVGDGPPTFECSSARRAESAAFQVVYPLTSGEMGNLHAAMAVLESANIWLRFDSNRIEWEHDEDDETLAIYRPDTTADPVPAKMASFDFQLKSP